MAKCAVLAKAPSIDIPVFCYDCSVLESASDLDYLFRFKLSIDKCNLVLLSIVLGLVTSLSVILGMLLLIFISLDLHVMAQFSIIRVTPSHTACY